ncbi:MULTISPECIES: lmo0937 family membrane protein [Pontibacillus]|uniref:Lmo0937 family membrane protein n=1 Tax=Pontibacillus chungwhensis TaxID=265426 RepID=A0ABY8V1X0_9BACI|nr:MULTISPECIES: lmo0937 family membrane protein [Pontibacillus]MCD5324706.1 lmo0937 family membrane protein [Pontibacillus sp. HN14]WIF99001.1 lmo0937 family membrane protein [Pontibacillus chungwhensis]
MLWTILLILLLFWLFGVIFKIAGGIIHILLVVALVLLVYRLIKGRKP